MRVVCRVEPLKVPRVNTRYTEDDLVMREFLRDTSRRVIRAEERRQAVPADRAKSVAA